MTAVADHQLLLFPAVRPLGDRFDANFFRSVPEEPGVYLLSATRDGVLYVGKARNLRQRLGSYRSGSSDRLPRKLVRLLQRVERIDWDVCLDEAAALVRERELIRALQPRFNTQGVRPPRQWFIGSRCHHGSLFLRLEAATENASDCTQWWGPFTFAQPAFAALVRSLWRELHPRTSVAELPSRLLSTTGPGLRQWHAPWDERVAAWLVELNRFLTGQHSRLLGREDALINRIFGNMTTGPLQPPLMTKSASIVPRVAHASPFDSRQLFAWPGARDRLEKLGLIAARTLTFDEQWRAQDTECLADFYAQFAAKIDASAPAQTSIRR